MHSEKQYETPEEFVARWRQVGPQLEQFTLQEQQALSEEEHRAAVQSLLALADPTAGKDATSGLVEQQQWFARARSQ